MASFTPHRTLKRAAQDVLQSPPSKIPRSAEPFSINNILRKHARQRLYVQPLHWTAKHLHLLDCAFVPESRVDGHWIAAKETKRKRKRKQKAGRQILVQSVTSATACLSIDYGPEIKVAVVCNLLLAHGFHRVCSDLRFAFAKRPVCHLPTNGLFASSPTAPAALAFLDLKILARRRDQSIATAIPTCNRMNPPAVRLRRKKQASLRPINVTHDPYIAAVLIGLAQGQRQPTTSPDNHSYLRLTSPVEPMESRRNSTSFEVFLLAMNSQELYLYTAKIPLAFLHRLDKPWKYSYVEPVRLRYYCLSLQSSVKISKIFEDIVKSLGKSPSSQGDVV